MSETKPKSHWERALRTEPVGSPAYIRRLRDQVAGRVLVLYLKECDAFDAVDSARHAADALVKALGYQPPGESGKEG